MIHGMLDEMVERIYKRVNVIRRDRPNFSINFDDDSEEETQNFDDDSEGETQSDSDSGKHSDDSEEETQSDSGECQIDPEDSSYEYYWEYY